VAFFLLQRDFLNFYRARVKLSMLMLSAIIED